MNSEELKRFKEYLKELNNESDLAVLLAASETKVKKENSNNIVVYTGSYRKEKDLIFLTYDEDLKTSFKQYMDIETGELYQIPIKDIEEFEKTHKVIYRETPFNNIQLYDRKYDEIKVDFFRSVLNEPQEKVVLRLTNKK